MFPNGMHSTLLQLDAVAQIERKRRKGKPTTLAWEDPHQHGAEMQQEEDDDDIPLGVLFPGKNGLINKVGVSNWDKPLGLLARRDREENEPLSKRRNRLLGISNHSPQQVQMQPLVPNEYVPPDDEPTSEHEDETLAQRHRRLRSRKALDEALQGEEDNAGFGSNDGARGANSDFASEWLSQFGGLEQAGPNGPNADQEESSEDDHPGETLGQRRRRLQAEAQMRQASGSGIGVSGIPLDHEHGLDMMRASTSLGNLLSANPGAITSGPRQISGESGFSSGLIGDNEQRRMSRHQQISNQNQWSHLSRAPHEPLVNIVAGQKDTNFRGDPVVGMGGRPNTGGYLAGRFNDGTGGVAGQVRSRASMMSMGLNAGGQPGKYHPQNQQQQQRHKFGSGWNNTKFNGQHSFAHGFGASQSPTPYGGHGTATGMGPPGGLSTYAHQLQQNVMYEPPQAQAQPQVQEQEFLEAEPLSPLQREHIDRWRNSITQ